MKNLKVTTSNKPKFTPIDVSISFTIDDEKELRRLTEAKVYLDAGNQIDVCNEAGETFQYNFLSKVVTEIINNVG